MSEEIQKTLAEEIAEALGEKQILARKQIQSIVDRYGEEGARALLEETLAIESNGGLMTNNGTRRRTIGGVFFYLAIQRTAPLERYQIRQNFLKKSMMNAGELKPYVPRRFKWQPKKLEELFERHGEVTAVKITLTGRPGRIQHYKEMIVTTMKGTGIPSQFPRGVPAPPNAPTDYIIYISSRQWKKVVDAIKNPEDALIIEGYCAFDAEAKAIGVYTTAITTRLLRIALKEKQKAEMMGQVNGGAPAEDIEEQEAAPAPKPREAKPAAPRAPKPVAQNKTNNTHTQAAPAPRPVVAPPPTPTISREEATAMLARLYHEEDEARDAMEEIKSLPPSEQTGLGEALRELTRIKNEVKTIKQQYPGL